MKDLPACVFVYGTLKPGHRNYAVALKAGPHDVVGPALLSGFTMFGLTPEFYPGITEGEGTIAGVVLKYHDMDTALPILDELEELHLDPPGYRRDVLTVQFEDGSTQDCIVYIYIRQARMQQEGIYPIHSGVWQED
ncbi:gamma-glutamylcyclotransferase family protein [Deinococcus roseus]|uniref:Gamma-glutamylcyclotransferase AIG2-like domain-containing protein n=1 Tax=Deinococcus roseus TaxID=392414 RepID=A0ABQ2D4U8_9DEIO|nr:gamma-glutamylcyclotransferase family protein [Deinococcus roseus]GGJ40006.1 hypothetical protein GCM10008938_27510 [Deinococcus roseus]